ncbi:PQQ-dependent sugar dehydrogenase [Enhydrobacter sp.]|jgi:glucose/arabinose dehydrogenase/mono/diheme cytochrome c family protein|uniref:PQQ-dependent sugar dehydrogenase n=1 Tax=Enhydrobacter sp. TaxID=1894999 RepID=UPI0026306D50|nr:PQQ-dependent sugar dehydrogenase [Enhydrobacter sp.]WIM10551.1 MAG: L-sorbosone dehydrogenase [Enhydrobacter sp.]
MTIWNRRGVRAAIALTSVLAAIVVIGAVTEGRLAAQPSRASRCPGDNGGLALSPGFCATVFADNLGHVRHLAVAADGTLYANSWSGRYYRRAPPAGGFLIALKDIDRDGRADSVQRFGATPRAGGTGGTGIALYDGALYAEENGRILRYALTPGASVPAGAPTEVVSGLPLTGDHPMHPFAIDAKGDLFVDLASATNACQAANRMAGARGRDLCIEKRTRGGIWRYDADKTGQVFSPAERYASGIRNAEGLAFDAAGRLFATQHGRDQLYQNWPRLYTAEQSAELPAEELIEVTQGADYGWPECYYDQNRKKLVLAPEYGGDGGRAVGLCADRRGPVAAFPGHWAPNALAIYLGDKFPAGYRGGAFIAFHGSWNRAPLPQAGFNVVFQPLADGKAAGPYVVFADGFDGGHKEPGRAAFRPSGLAVAPDGALFVSDDVHGRIWRITYDGDGSDKVTPARTGSYSATASSRASPPEGVHRDAGRKAQPLPTPPGATAEQVALGDRIYHGEASNGACSGCHGSDGGGSSVGPPLSTGQWLWTDGSLDSLRSIIARGVPKPKRYQGAMPPMGGSPLTPSDLAAVSAYVWAISHANHR